MMVNNDIYCNGGDKANWNGQWLKIWVSRNNISATMIKTIVSKVGSNWPTSSNTIFYPQLAKQTKILSVIEAYKINFPSKIMRVKKKVSKIAVTSQNNHDNVNRIMYTTRSCTFLVKIL